MIDIKPEPFGRCADDRCPGRCPYRDPELMTPEGRAALLEARRPSDDGTWPAKVVHVTCQPEDALVEVPRVKAKNVGILLKTLGLRQGTRHCGLRRHASHARYSSVSESAHSGQKGDEQRLMRKIAVREKRAVRPLFCGTGRSSCCRFRRTC